VTTNQVKQRKLVIFNMVTLDGFFEGPKGDINWHRVDQEFNEFAIEQIKTVDVIMFGRVTYQMMASYWPTAAAIADDPIVAGQMNAMPKIVFSKTLDKAEWNNTTLVKGDLAAEVAKLKQQPGKDLIIFGSANLGGSLTKVGLIDEYRIIVNPIVIGKGTPLFQRIDAQLKLKLLRTRIFDSGNVLLVYEPVRAE
jgi:dihydrofolate reductase